MTEKPPLEPLFERAVIAGVGLIGGSLALAGKKAGLFKTTVGFGRTAATLEKAMELGVVDETTTDISEAVDGADFFFAAVPVETIVPLCLSVGPKLAQGCVITDGGSVKGHIVKELEGALPAGVRFVGGHPVAGTEKSGPEAAFETLFEGRYTILTPTDSTDSEAVALVRKMWEGAGSKVVTMSPEEHDAALATISHMPHLVAYALVQALDEADSGASIRRFVAGGFKDTTRIAASHPAMWRDIFSMNRDKVLASVKLFESCLTEFTSAIEENDFDGLEKKLEKIRDLRLGIEDI